MVQQSKNIKMSLTALNLPNIQRWSRNKITTLTMQFRKGEKGKLAVVTGLLQHEFHGAETGAPFLGPSVVLSR